MLGTIVYSSRTGLGYQSKAFYDHMKPDRTLLVDLSQHNLMPINRDWYPDARYTTWPNQEDIEWLLECDVVYYAETPLNFDLHALAASKGVKVVQAYNYEFLDYFRQPDYPKPTLLAAPTKWNIDRVKQLDVPVEHWPIPTDRTRFPFRLIDECKTFLHVIGRPAVHDRNGTLAFLDAVEHYGDRFEYRIFLQTPKDHRAQQFFQPVLNRLNQLEHLIEIVYDHNDPTYMYRSGDVLVLPRRYGGLCLPANEALSSGLPVIMTDISPNNDLLPTEWLCDAHYDFKFHENQDTRYAHVNVDVYKPDTQSLIDIMGRFTDKSYMRLSNLIADHIAKQYSWETLLEFYQQKLCQ